MVTYRYCQARLLVRFQPLHFLICCLALFCLLSGSALAVDEQDSVYQPRQDVMQMTLSEVLQDPALMEEAGIMPLATITRYTVFGRTFTYDADTQEVTRINGFSDLQWANFDKGDRLLASVVLDTLLGVQMAIDDVAGEVVVELDKWVNTKSAPEIANSVQHTGISVPNLLAVLASNQQQTYNRFFDSYLFENLKLGIVQSGSFGHGISAITSNQAFISSQLDTTLYNRVWSAWHIAGKQEYKNQSVGDLLAMITLNQAVVPDVLNTLLSETSTVPTLLSSGQTENLNGSNMVQVTRMGFAGLASLFSGSGNRVIHMNTVDPNDPLNTDAGTIEFPSLFDYLGYTGENLTRELTKLRFVLASDDDIQMKQEEKPNEDAVKDNFFGNGEGSVSTSNISDAAGLTSSAKDTFGGAGSAGDVFVVAGNQDTYSFFSEAVANDLDAVNSVAVISEDDDWLLDLPQDENGFYYNEFLSPEDYLKGR